MGRLPHGVIHGQVEARDIHDGRVVAYQGEVLKVVVLVLHVRLQLHHPGLVLDEQLGRNAMHDGGIVDLLDPDDQVDDHQISPVGHGHADVVLLPSQGVQELKLLTIHGAVPVAAEEVDPLDVRVLVMDEWRHVEYRYRILRRHEHREGVNLGRVVHRLDDEGDVAGDLVETIGEVEPYQVSRDPPGEKARQVEPIGRDIGIREHDESQVGRVVVDVPDRGPHVHRERQVLCGQDLRWYRVARRVVHGCYDEVDRALGLPIPVMELQVNIGLQYAVREQERDVETAHPGSEGGGAGDV